MPAHGDPCPSDLCRAAAELDPDAMRELEGARRGGGSRAASAETWYHGTPDERGWETGARYGIHVGTEKSAREALNARIGRPHEGVWDGTREYGKTLLSPYQVTGAERGGDAPHYPSGRAAYSGGEPIPMDARPNVFPVRIKGPMTNSPQNPMDDFPANARMRGQITRGQARRGYYYQNVSEDEGSVSAVVPSAAHLERVYPHEAARQRTAALEGADYDGETGNRDHITRTERGEIPLAAVARMPGARGEVPGEHRNRQGKAWEDFKSDIAANGIRSPVFITVDHGQDPVLSEGSHRRDAAAELGMTHVPAEIRYYGHAEREGTVLERARRRTAGYDPYGDRDGEEEDDEDREHARQWDDIHGGLEDIHRGMGIHLHPDDHAIVHDESRPLAERAHHLLRSLPRSSYGHGHDGQVGTHWTSNENVAEDFGETGSKREEDGRTGTSVVFHAHAPDRDDIDERPDERAGDIYGYRDHGEREVPLRPGASVHLKGISWKPMHGGYWGDEDEHGESQWVDGPEDRDYSRHDFGPEGHHVEAGLLRGAGPDSNYEISYKHFGIPGEGRHKIFMSDRGNPLGDIHWDERTGEIGMIHVVPGMRRKGIGTSLLQQAGNYARSHGITEPVHSEDMTESGAALRSSVEGVPHSPNIRSRKSAAERPTRTQQQVSYRAQAAGPHQCGNCAMFRLRPPDFDPWAGACTLVKGMISRDGTCDEWAPEKGARTAAGPGTWYHGTPWALEEGAVLEPGHPPAGDAHQTSSPGTHVYVTNDRKWADRMAESGAFNLRSPYRRVYEVIPHGDLHDDNRDPRAGRSFRTTGPVEVGRMVSERRSSGYHPGLEEPSAARHEGSADGPYYHGTRHVFPPGHELTPQGERAANWTDDDDEIPGQHVHVTTSRAGAEMYAYSARSPEHLTDPSTGYAPARVYEVRPSGPLAPDPNDAFGAWRTQRARVIREAGHDEADTGRISWHDHGPARHEGSADGNPEQFVTCGRGHLHWGALGAAGLLARHQDAEGRYRYLLQRRADHVQHGGTWSTPGGALHPGETPAEGALREASQEMGQLPGDLEPHRVSTDDHGGWRYHTVIMDSPSMFRPRGGDGEGEDHGWFTPSEVRGLDLHPGFAATWDTVRQASRHAAPGGQGRTAASGYRYEHLQPASRAVHWVNAYHPDGHRVGDMTWKAGGDHHVTWIGVYDKDDRRKGIATGMWNKAREVDPLVSHNDSEDGQTDAGRAWARTTPGGDGARQAARHAVMHEAAGSGMMVALVPPGHVKDHLQEAMAPLTRHDPEDRDQLHVTVLYLGKESDHPQAALDKLPELVRMWAMTQEPFTAAVQGAGTFANQGEHPLVALVDVPGEARHLHASLSSFLKGHGISFPEKHSWIPHLTLSYSPHPVRFLPGIERREWPVSDVYYCRGGSWTPFPLGR